MTLTERRCVLVTGAAGFVGIPVTKALLARGFEVVALDNFSVGSEAGLRDAIGDRPASIAEVDLRDADGVRRAVADAAPWGVIHLAAIHFIPYCVEHPAEAVAVNVAGTQHLLDGLLAADPRRIVFASTADVYEPSEVPHAEHHPVRPINVYGATKLVGEQLVSFHRERQPALETVVARLFNVYGPGETNPHVMPAIFEQLESSRTLALGNMTPRRDYIYVEDMANALVSLLADAPDGTTVNVGPGRSASVADVVKLIEELLGPVEVQTDPTKVRRSDRPRLEADTTRLATLLPEFSPVELRDGLRATLEAVGLLERDAVSA
jgi:UDP-glucose 4-epimerase